MNEDVIKALEEDGFVSIKSDWKKWEYRNDLFDYVVMKGIEFIVGFINQVEWAKRRTLAALFIKRYEIVDDVLKNIKYDDNDLFDLTNYQPELAELHDNFFTVIGKINDPENQEIALKWGVSNLFGAKKHDSVIPLINALEKRQFNDRNLKDAAIQKAFYEGARRGTNDIAEEFHEHHAITPWHYANGLIESWKNDKLNTFPFLLSQADQSDLEKVKKDYKYKEDPEFSKVIDDAFSRAEPAGARLRRPKRRVELVKEAFSETAGIQSLAQEKGPGDIILGYLNESEGTEGGKGQ